MDVDHIEFFVAESSDCSERAGEIRGNWGDRTVSERGNTRTEGRHPCLRWRSIAGAHNPHLMTELI